MWFSIVSSQSDLVVFIADEYGEFSESQKLEMGMTSPRVNKKIVEIPSIEFKWKSKLEFSDDTRPSYILGGKQVSEEEWLKMEAEHAQPFLESFSDSGFPKDRLIRVADEITEYPLDYNEYE